LDLFSDAIELFLLFPDNAFKMHRTSALQEYITTVRMKIDLPGISAAKIMADHLNPFLFQKIEREFDMLSPNPIISGNGRNDVPPPNTFAASFPRSAPRFNILLVSNSMAFIP